MQIKLTQLLNELGINTPGRASIAQLERWKAEIQASDDEMTQIKLALRCAEGVMWIWREKYPNDNRPQVAINAVKAYIKDPSDENAQNCEKAARDAWDAADDAYAAATAATVAYVTAYATAAFAADYAADYAIKALIKYQEEHQLNELGINPPIRASIAQLERWKAEIQASDDEMTQIKLALRCAEGVIWIWREKYPNDNRPQAAINALKNYIKDPSAENAQNCENAAYDAWVAGNVANDATTVAAAAAAAAAVATAVVAAAVANTDNAYAYISTVVYHATQAITKYQKKNN